MTAPNTPHNSTTADRENYAYAFIAWAHDEFFASETPPKLRISHGQAPGSRPKRKHKQLGACFNTAASSDGYNEMFCCPTETNTLNMLVTYLHEYCHALDNCKSGHKGNFVRLAKMCGLDAPYTSTPPTEELREVLEWYINEYGDIPAGHLKAAARTAPKQSTRMLKAECDDCGFVARVSRTQGERWADAGALCPVCQSETRNVTIGA